MRVLSHPGPQSLQPNASPTRGPIPLPAAPVQKEAPNEFERMLDAEISGDLSRLTASVDVKPQADAKTNADTVAGRQEPRLGPAPQRTEPSLEDEMNRMLGEISVGRKN